MEDDRIGSARQFRRIALAVCLVGVAAQLALTAYYLGMGHAAHPRHLPVGLTAAAADQARATAVIEQDGSFTVTPYGSAQALVAAVQRRAIYGGADLTGPQPVLYVAGAAGPAAASALRTAYTQVLEQRTASQVAQLSTAGQPVPVATVAALTAAPRIIDVVPLPPDDRTGVSLGFLVQALALGGSIASIGLGRLIPRTRRSYKRGLGHLATLVAYAAGSAVAVLWSMSWFGVGSAADHGQMFWCFSLVSLAITASTAAAVALVGPAGAMLGFLYFTIGTVISGASILPEFLPGFGRRLGDALPTGAGVQAVRDSLYFPAASIDRPVLTLSLYAGVGCLVVLLTNIVPNRGDRTAQLEVHPATLITGNPEPAAQPT